jgi:Spy/CpxP family protein refolding chaperone
MTAPSRPLAGSPWIAALVILLAGLSGGIAGVAVDRLLLLPHLFHGGPGERHGRGGPPGGDFSERFARELGLTSDQKARVDSIMDREMRGVREVRAAVQPRLDSIIARTRREMDAVLTPEQRKKAEEMRRRHPPRPGPRDGPPSGPSPGAPPLGDQGGPPPPRP